MLDFLKNSVLTKLETWHVTIFSKNHWIGREFLVQQDEPNNFMENGRKHQLKAWKEFFETEVVFIKALISFPLFFILSKSLTRKFSLNKIQIIILVFIH